MTAIKTETAHVYEYADKSLLVIPNDDRMSYCLPPSDSSEEAVLYRKLIEEKRRNGN